MKGLLSADKPRDLDIWYAKGQS